MSDAEMQQTLSKALVHSGQDQARRAIAEFNAKLQDSLAALGARTGLTFTLPGDKTGQYRMLDALIGTELISVSSDGGPFISSSIDAKTLLEQQASERTLRRLMVGAATLIEDAMKAMVGEEESTIIKPGDTHVSD